MSIQTLLKRKRLPNQVSSLELQILIFESLSKIKWSRIWKHSRSINLLKSNLSTIWFKKCPIHRVKLIQNKAVFWASRQPVQRLWSHSDLKWCRHIEDVNSKILKKMGHRFQEKIQQDSQNVEHEKWGKFQANRQLLNKKAKDRE